MTTESPEVGQKQTVSRKFKEPKKYKVIVLNDDATPIEFVIAMFMTIFRKDESEAYNLTMQIHNTGSAVAGIFPHEVADQKVADGHSMAQAHGHPLQLKAEKE